MIFSLLLLLLIGAPPAHAQTSGAIDETATDPVKLFEQGQDAHARGQLQSAIDLYAKALKLHRNFPEAEYQSAAAFIALNRLPEAEQALQRAIALRTDWALPHAMLGALLARTNRDRAAETALQRALELDADDLTAIVALAQVRARAGNNPGALELWQRATTHKGATASMWTARAATERAAGDAAAASASLDRALSIDPGNVAARLERAATRINARDFKNATEDIRAAEAATMKSASGSGAPDVRSALLHIANLYHATGNKNQALNTLDRLDDATKQSTEVIALRSEISGETDAQTVAALEKLVASDPPNASRLAQLAAVYRTTNPERSLQLYRRAADLEPRNLDYAVGYAAALIQAKRFSEAVSILQRIITVAPNNYAAHANLATALDELKQYGAAIAEYEWISAQRPELAITKFFIGRAYDLTGQYAQALAAYEAFVAQADQNKNGLEIEKVNLRLPVLRNQVKRAGGTKKEK